MNLTKEQIITWALALAIGAIGGFLTNIIMSQLDSGPTQEELISLYYESESAALVSPHHLRKEMDLGHRDKFILVDVRTSEEYIEEHVVGAVNIDASQSPEEVVAQFSELLDQDKEIIMYCYSSACLTGRKVGRLLAQNDIFVHELSVGWNEWKYDFEGWNYPNEWDTLDPDRYVVSGEEPGELEALDGEVPPPCRIDGPLGC